ncbi:hypothetical protein CBR_g46242 [Chara braunii]|uniref:Uncharacterized protein n=1 Tax=Chara braunii TaxID=69332 RepID=A0A388K3W9_CHABU|nr:hypothetical protein CBR_g46242 [Chara braunii]|eukprot:GBG64699.1 hypothetical protein CBR_g46242 [Chara braunii]
MQISPDTLILAVERKHPFSGFEYVVLDVMFFLTRYMQMGEHERNSYELIDPIGNHIMRNRGKVSSYDKLFVEKSQRPGLFIDLAEKKMKEKKEEKKKKNKEKEMKKKEKKKKKKKKNDKEKKRKKKEKEEKKKNKKMKKKMEKKMKKKMEKKMEK